MRIRLALKVQRQTCGYEKKIATHLVRIRLTVKAQRQHVRVRNLNMWHAPYANLLSSQGKT